MLFHVHDLISHVSQYMTLKMGDILFTGTPSGVGPVADGDVLEGSWMSNPCFACKSMVNQVFLVGYMGSGKTSVAKSLSANSGLR